MKNIFLYLAILLPVVSSCGIISSGDGPKEVAEAYVRACLSCDYEGMASVADDALASDLKEAFAMIEQSDSLTNAGVNTILSAMQVLSSSESEAGKDSVSVNVVFGDSLVSRNAELLVVKSDRGWKVVEVTGK